MRRSRYGEDLTREQRRILAVFAAPYWRRKAVLAGARVVVRDLERRGYIQRWGARGKGAGNGALYMAEGGKLLLGARTRAALADLAAVMDENGEPMPLPTAGARRLATLAPVVPLPCPDCGAPLGSHAKRCPRMGKTRGARRAIRCGPRDPSLPRVITPQRPQGESVRYVVVEAADLVTSHLPASFQPNPEYPAHVQERSYHSSQGEQLKVIQGAQALEPAFLLADTPTPVDGPPIVTEGSPRLVLGGNGRAMMILRALHGPGYEAYLLALRQKAPGFGVKLDGLREPVLVRELVGVFADGPSEELAAAVRRFNEGMTQSLAPAARAIADARLMSVETVESIGRLLAEREGWTLRDLLREAPGPVAGMLEADGIVTPQNRSAWLTTVGLTEEAKERIQGMFLGRVLGSWERLARCPAAILAKVERIAASLVCVAGVNPECDEIPAVQAALDVVSEARSKDLPVEVLARQGSLFGGVEPDEVALDLALLFEHEGVRALAARFQAWAAVAARDPRQGGLFGETPDRDAVRALLATSAEFEEGRQAA